MDSKTSETRKKIGADFVQYGYSYKAALTGVEEDLSGKDQTLGAYADIGMIDVFVGAGRVGHNLQVQATFNSSASIVSSGRHRICTTEIRYSEVHEAP